MWEARPDRGLTGSLPAGPGPGQEEDVAEPLAPVLPQAQEGRVSEQGPRALGVLVSVHFTARKQVPEATQVEVPAEEEEADPACLTHVVGMGVGGPGRKS